MAGKPIGSNQNVKRGSASLRFLRRPRILVFAAMAVALSVGSYVAFSEWITSSNRDDKVAADASLEQGDYEAAYTKLKTVEQRGGTEQKSGEKSYRYWLDLAKAAYLAGDESQAKRYAEKGLASLPPEDTPAYLKAESAMSDLTAIREGAYFYDPPAELDAPSEAGR